MSCLKYSEVLKVPFNAYATYMKCTVHAIKPKFTHLNVFLEEQISQAPHALSGCDVGTHFVRYFVQLHQAYSQLVERLVLQLAVVYVGHLAFVGSNTRQSPV